VLLVQVFVREAACRRRAYPGVLLVQVFVREEARRRRAYPGVLLVQVFVREEARRRRAYPSFTAKAKISDTIKPGTAVMIGQAIRAIP
jgi:hypothetical protein